MLDATKTVNGTFCTMYHEGQWLTNVTRAEATIEISKEEINRAGTRWVGHKQTALTGSGSMSGYKITNEFMRLIGQIADDSQGAFVTELIMKVADPENPEVQTRIRLKGVQFDAIPLLNYEVNSIVEEETPFTFSGYEEL